MGALVTRAASCIIDPFRELIGSPISTPLGLWSTVYYHRHLAHPFSVMPSGLAVGDTDRHRGRSRTPLQLALSCRMCGHIHYTVFTPLVPDRQGES